MLHGTLISSAPQPFNNPLNCVRRSERSMDWRVFFSPISSQGETTMLAKYMTAGLIGSALLASVAFAQQSPTATSDKADTAPAAASDSSFQGNWRASKLLGLSVYNDNNESLGSINDLLMDKDGSIKGIVLVAGGQNANAPGPRPAPSTTTGAAPTNSAPATAATTKSNPWYPDHAMVSATKDQLKAMPEFKYAI